MKQHYFDVPFAFAGDVTAIPDPLQVGGTVSMTEGWNNNYQRNLSTDPAALPIDRSTTNWLLLQISTALQALQQAGVPEFILASQNGGAAYSYGKGASVLWSASGNAPFVKYVSLTAGNTNTPSASDPQGLTTGWQIEVDPISTAAQASAGTDDASIMTPLKVAQQTVLRALLAGSSSQVFNVATATASTHAVPLGQLPTLNLIRTVKTTVITATGTYTPTAGLVYADVQVVGGGGGGASGNNSLAAGGGAGGGYCRAVLSAATIGASQSVTIGAGGAAGSAAGNGGIGGGVTSFGALIVCAGGAGGIETGGVTGVGSTSMGGAATTSPSGSLAIGGTFGGYGLGSASLGIGGNGATGLLGSGANGTQSAVGSTGSGYGTGGGGAHNALGGAGRPGVVIITEYCSQ